MISFLQKLTDTARMFSDRPAVVDNDGDRITSYAELYENALKVNAYLRMQGIGKEDVCAIYFKRSMEYIATRIGIMMAGAAFVGLEDLMGKERIDFVIKDSGCKLVFDGEKWQEAMGLTPCSDIADPDPHDLAYIIYTSGSTGNPKGVMQEYGGYENMQRGTRGFFEEYADPEPMNFAEVAPQTFVSGVYTTVGILDVRGTIHEISMELIRNMDALSRYFIENNIHHTFMTPTFIKLLLKDPDICLRAASVGGEVVSDVYTDRYDIINVYGPSEFGFPTCLFKLDKAYDNTPIGFPANDNEIVLLNEEGDPDMEGVFCINLPYFRGYLLDNPGEFVYIGGKKFFKTSDYVKKNTDGSYVMLDRLDDMVKINGNRVDTKEVEAAVRKCLKVDFCCVKLFMNNGIKALCAYYTGDEKIDSIAAAAILRDHIPEYMIPSYYLRLKDIPLNANGKLDKNALPKPSGVIRVKPYAPPVNKAQMTLCDAMKKALDIKEDIGIDDDFFVLGGDSIRAMETLSYCKMPGLSVQMVYEGRTVRRIMEILESVKALNSTASGTEKYAKLNAGQVYLLKKDLTKPQSCMLNLPIRFDIMPGSDYEKLEKAINKAISLHRALSSVIEEKNGSYYLRYREEPAISLKVEEMSDEAMKKEIDAFVKPFDPFEGPLFRGRIIKGEQKGVILLDVYHVICDGYSYQKLVDDIGSVYEGDEITEDSCFELLCEEERYHQSDRFTNDMEYFRTLYDKEGWETYPRVDHETGEDVDDNFFVDFDFTKKDVDTLVKKYGIGRGGVYLAALALAIASYNQSENVMFTWTWHGRSDEMRMNSVGYFSKDIPIAFRLKKGLLLSKLYEDIMLQIRDGISHGNVSYWEEMGSYEGKDLVCFLYQGDVYEYHDGEGIVNSMVKMPSQVAFCNNILDIEVLDGRDNFGVLLDYNAGKYERESMELFGKLFCKMCSILLKSNPNTTTVETILKAV